MREKTAALRDFGPAYDGFGSFANRQSPQPVCRLRPESGSPPSKAGEYHLIDLFAGVSQGGFETLTGARQGAREKGLSAWDIFHGNVRVEYHDPR
jgi:hypothetical protein